MAKAKTAKEFDRRFDAGEDIFDLAEIDSEKIKRPGLETKRINIDVLADFWKELDAHAGLYGIAHLRHVVGRRIQTESAPRMDSSTS